MYDNLIYTANIFVILIVFNMENVSYTYVPHVFISGYFRQSDLFLRVPIKKREV